MNIPKEIQTKIPAVLVTVIESRFDDAVATQNRRSAPPIPLCG